VTVPRGVDPVWSRDVEEVAGRLGGDLRVGLTDVEARRRLVEGGPNELARSRPVPTWRKILGHFQDPLIYLLLVAVAISVAVWLAEGAEGAPVDALVIGVIVVANAVLGYVQERRAEQAVAALQQMTAASATVVRDGSPRRVPATEVVVGDLLLLEEGDTVAADGRLADATALKVSEASLTGESEPVLKDARRLPEQSGLADRTDMVYSGTAVVQGTGRAVVTATAMGTEMGQIADLLSATTESPTPLEQEMAGVGRMLGLAVVGIAVVVMGTLLLTSEINSSDDVVTVLLLGVSLAVAAVPEGLPAILSLVLALGVQRMARHRAIVKKLSSVETLGSASVICTDKTGTLTRAEMTVGCVVTASGDTEVTGVGYEPEGEVLHEGEPLDEGSDLWREVYAVLSGGTLASNASLREEAGEWSVLGDPTEGAFLVAERKLGSHERRAERFRRVGHVPFTAERRLMSTLERDTERSGSIAVVTKGAPDALLHRCNDELVGWATVPLVAARRAALVADVERLSAQGYRTLGVAYRLLEVTAPPDADESLEQGLVFAGMVGIIDPPRAEAKAAVEEAQRAGIRVRMITGDHPLTAARIGSDLGLMDGGRVLTGEELDGLDDEALRDIAPDVCAYARVTPAHKLRIVGALKSAGQVVAMTGDGVNDAPALKSADIGVAMGASGTEVAKEAASMILADDNFATIVEAVREGRGIFENIKKFLRYLLSSNMGEVLAVFLGVVLASVIGLTSEGDAVVLPLLATQILWINLLTDTGPALAMGVDPQTDDVMARPPRGERDRVIDGRMWVWVGLIGLVMSVATLAAIDLYLPGGLLVGTQTLANARTAGFTVLVLAQLFNCFNARSDTSSAFSHVFANSWLWGAVGLSALLQVAVVSLPFLNEAFATAPLSGEQWLVCTALASSVLWVSEVGKLVIRRTSPSRRLR
jgi:P-type Ca2+ transporter type 2C